MSEATTVVYRGERVTFAQLSALCGVAVATLRQRIQEYGWPVERAASTPVAKRSRSGGRLAANVPRPVPRLKRHPSGRAYSRWKLDGKTHERYFGKHGSPEAAASYRKFAADWVAGLYEVREGAAPVGAGGLMVAEIAARWMDHVRGYYLKNGKPTNEVTTCRTAARLVVELYGDAPAATFDPAALRACRNVWIEKKLTRGTCNGYARRLVRMLRWGAGQSLVLPTVPAALALVEALKAGRSEAHDRPKKRPATDAQVKATLPFLAPADPARRAKLADMIRLQRLTGMRPGEVCALSVADLDPTGEIWRYTVGKSNKNLHRGRAQVYYLGPKAVAVLTPYLAGDPVGPVFGEGAMDYGQAVYRASVKAGKPWTPHQLRHALATEVAEKFRSLEHAAAAIGDTEAVASAVYIHVDPRERAKIEVARLMG